MQDFFLIYGSSEKKDFIPTGRLVARKIWGVELISQMAAQYWNIRFDSSTSAIVTILSLIFDAVQIWNAVLLTVRPRHNPIPIWTLHQ